MSRSVRVQMIAVLADRRGCSATLIASRQAELFEPSSIRVRNEPNCSPPMTRRLRPACSGDQPRHAHPVWSA